MKAVILAAGKGTRLKPITLTIPKPLIEVAGKTILNHAIDNLPDEIDEVIIITKHLEEKIIAAVEQIPSSIKITTISQGENTGTFGALLTVRNMFSENERFLVINGDDLHNKEELENFLTYPLAIGVQMKVMPGYYAMELDENGVLKKFREQTDAENENGTLIATGAYLLDSNIFNFNPVKINDGELGLPQTLIQNSSTHPLNVVETKKWKPINTLEDWELANSKTL